MSMATRSNPIGSPAKSLSSMSGRLWCPPCVAVIPGFVATRCRKHCGFPSDIPYLPFFFAPPPVTPRAKAVRLKAEVSDLEHGKMNVRVNQVR
jgi:hypothetical protein